MAIQLCLRNLCSCVIIWKFNDQGGVKHISSFAVMYLTCQSCGCAKDSTNRAVYIRIEFEALSVPVQQPKEREHIVLLCHMLSVEQVECQSDLMSLSCEDPGWHMHAPAVWILGPFESFALLEKGELLTIPYQIHICKMPPRICHPRGSFQILFICKTKMLFGSKRCCWVKSNMGHIVCRKSQQPKVGNLSHWNDLGTLS